MNPSRNADSEARPGGKDQTKLGSHPSDGKNDETNRTWDGSDATVASSAEALGPVAITSNRRRSRFLRDSSVAGDSPQVFGDYEILDQIAHGGMGVVYKARQIKLNRIVAIKMILRGHLASPNDVQRFYAEAEAAAGLSHVGIVQVFEVGQVDDQHYFSMEYVDGTSLADLISDGPLSNELAAQLMDQIVDAIQYAHTKGVIHRDLKPSNVLIDEKGKPKVTDFGLAKKVEGDSDLTATGQVIGTPGFMPPEQATAKLDQIGPVSDVYGLGALMYSLLVARPPFQSATAFETLMMAIKEEPLAPRLLNPAVDQDLETICLKCLEKSPTRRYSSAAAVANELNRYLAGQPILSRRIGRVDRIFRWCKRNPAVATLSTVAAMLLILGTVISSIFAVRSHRESLRAAQRETEAIVHLSTARREAQRADENAAKAQDRETLANKLLGEVEVEKRRAKAELANAKRLLNLVHVRGAQREWQSGNAATAWQHLDAVDHADFAFEQRLLFNLFTRNQKTLAGHRSTVRSVAVHPDGAQILSAAGSLFHLGGKPDELKLWNTQTGQDPRDVFQDGVRVTDVCFSADGLQFATASVRGTVTRYDAQTEKVLQRINDLGPLDSIAFSPDGKHLAVAGKRVLMVPCHHDPAGTETPITEFESEANRSFCVVFSRQGNRIYVGTDANDLVVYDCVSQNKVFQVSLSAGPVYCVAVDPLDRTIACGTGGGRLVLVDAASGQIIRRVRAHDLDVYSVAFHPKGRFIATGSGDHTIKTWDVETIDLRSSLEGHSGFVNDICFDSEGDWIVSGSSDRTLKIWPVGDRREAVVCPTGYVRAIAFDETSRLFVTAGHKITAWDPGGNFVRAYKSKNFVSAVACLPGRRLAAADSKGGLTFYDLDSAAVLETFSIAESGVRSFAVTSDGNRMALGTEDGQLLVFDATEKRLIRGEKIGPIVQAIRISPDDRILYQWVGGQKVVASELESGNVLFESRIRGNLYSMDISPDGALLAIGGDRRAIDVLNAKSGELLYSMLGRAHEIDSLQFSADGQRLFAGGTDESVVVWDLVSREPTLSLGGQVPRISSIAVSPSGEYLVCNSEDSSVRIWNVSDQTKHPAPDISASFGATVSWVPNDELVAPHSEFSGKHSLVRFENRSGADIHLHHVDTDGSRGSAIPLTADETLTKTTYRGHVWAVTDHDHRTLGHFVVGDLSGRAIVTSHGGRVETVRLNAPLGEEPRTVGLFANPQLEVNPETLLQLGNQHARNGRWDEAVQALAALDRNDPITNQSARYLAALYAYLRDEAAYQEQCQSLLQRWGDSNDPIVCERIGKACLLLPGEPMDERIDRMSKIAHAADDHPFHLWFELCFALYQTRSQQYEAAIATAREAQTKRGDIFLTTALHAVQAIAEARLGKVSQAAVTLGNTLEFCENHPAPEVQPLKVWPDWLVAQILIQEAAELVAADESAERE